MSGQTKHFYAFGPYRLDSQKRVLVRDGTPVPLAPKAAETLLLLVKNAGHLVEKAELMAQVWPDAFVEEGNLNRNIFVLRQLLGRWNSGREYIETVPRRGYRFVAPVSEVTHAEGDRQPQTSSANLIGKKVSHYRVLEVIGGGGMGLVYKAEDLKLGRRVALKFLPEELASDAVALQRFEREAQTASSLNHPNICTIYEIEEYEGQPFIVMELLEGETLRDWLASSASKAVPLDRLLDVALQICDGLQAAHQKGIIHRDIKPANIFLTASGQVKILDFGLAKLTVEAPGFSGAKEGAAEIPSDLSSRAEPPAFGGGHSAQDDSARVAEAALTRTGAAMGTAGYMSPEQVRGEKLDARTDLFSFGLVLYEIATGQRAFTGETAAVVRDAILNNSPAPLHELNTTLPAKLVTTIDKALEKDRSLRYQSAAEMGADLRGLQQSSSVRSRRSRFMFAGITVVVLCAALFLLLWFQPRKQRPAKEPTVRQLTANSSDNPLYGVSLSRDGKYLAYADKANGMSLLRVDTGEVRSLPSAAGFVLGNWLPDGDHVLVYKQGQAWKMSILNGTVARFGNEDSPLLASPDGKQFLTIKNNYEFWVLGADGTTPHKIVSVDPDWRPAVFTWAPTGQRILYLKYRTETLGETQIDSCDLQGHCTAVLSEPRLHSVIGLSDLEWLPDGRIIFSLRELPPNDSDTNAWSLEVDPDTGQPRGVPRRLTNWTGYALPSSTSSLDGKRLVFQRLRQRDSVKIAKLESGGSQMSNAQLLNSDRWPTFVAGWTHDSKTVLLTATRFGKRGIFEKNLKDGHMQALVSGGDSYDSPVLTPDGQLLLYTESLADGTVRLMRMPFHGGTATLVQPGRHSYACAALPSTRCLLADINGNEIVFSLLDPLKGAGKQVAKIESAKRRDFAWSLSSDGERIAVLEEGVVQQVGIVDLEGGSTKVIPAKGWNNLQSLSWSSDGSHLYVTGQSSSQRTWSLLYLDFAGRIKVLNEAVSQAWVNAPLPSPDGTHLIFNEISWENDAVMLENF